MIDAGTAIADIAFLRPVPAMVAPYFDRPAAQATSLMLASIAYNSSVAERDALVRTIGALSSLADNWDGYGASRIDPRTARNAITAAEGLLNFAPAPDVVPNPNGTITFAWETGDGEAHLEIGATRFSFFLIPRAGAISRHDGDATQIDPGIGAFVAEFLYPRRDSGKTITRIEYAVAHGRPFR